jgi:hypothetical protein
VVTWIADNIQTAVSELCFSLAVTIYNAVFWDVTRVVWPKVARVSEEHVAFLFRIRVSETT